MCGITGFLQPKEATLGQSVLLAMTHTLTHRGPDSDGHWMDEAEGIALGHRRLSIIDLSANAHQPMHSSTQRFVISYNGEAYNFLALKKELQKKGAHFSGSSDTEVILALLEQEGVEGALKQLKGMFALAIWDKKEKCLHLARDRIGEKPLYYGLLQGHFVFASELKAFKAHPAFRPVISSESITQYMQYGYIPAPYSIYENIDKLPPGTFLTLSRSALSAQPKPYWSARQSAQYGLAHPLSLSDTDAIAHTERLLDEIVQGQMISDRPIGAFLSGGIDSSLIAALMQKHHRTPVKTFTIGFEEKGYNEAPFAQNVATHLGTDHTELMVTLADVKNVIEKLPLMYDEPFADSSAIPTFLVSQLAKTQVTVSLSGDGGDELFGGYNRYLLAQRLWKKIALLPYPLRLLLQKMIYAVPPAQLEKLLSLTRVPQIGDKLHKLGGTLSARTPALFYEHLISQWHPNNAVTQSKKSTVLPQYQFLESLSFIENMMVSDTLSYLPDDILVKVDRAGMAVSLETRAPYLDHQLFEFIWQLPLAMKIRNHESKWLLRQILSQYVPSKLFERPKMGFGIPLDSWLRGPLRDWAESLLNKKALEQHGFLRAAPILEKWQEHLSGKRNWQHALWAVLMFQGCLT